MIQIAMAPTLKDLEVEKSNIEKKKEPCSSFSKKTNSEMCEIVKKQINLTCH